MTADWHYVDPAAPPPKGRAANSAARQGAAERS